MFLLQNNYYYDSSLLVTTVRKAFAENPKLTRPQLLPVILNWLSDANNPVKPEQPKIRAKNTKPDQWDTLEWDDCKRPAITSLIY